MKVEVDIYLNFRLIEGQYWTVGGIEWKDGWPQLLLLGDEGRGEVIIVHRLSLLNLDTSSQEKVASTF